MEVHLRVTVNGVPKERTVKTPFTFNQDGVWVEVTEVEKIKLEKFSVTISICVQIGVDTWKQEYHTKAFDVTSTTEEVLVWARTLISNATINDLTFSVFYE
jgi:hypothetical protein